MHYSYVLLNKVLNNTSLIIAIFKQMIIYNLIAGTIKSSLIKSWNISYFGRTADDVHLGGQIRKHSFLTAFIAILTQY
jgi:hypothetical protein